MLIPFLLKIVGPLGLVTAIDFSEKMIQICETKHSHIKNVKTQVGKIEDIAFPAESFYAVICFGVFPHIDQKEKALQNINSMLKSSGKLVIAHALSSEELKSHHKKVSENVSHSALPEKTEMRQLLERTGFVKISIRDEPGCYLCIARKPQLKTSVG